jgi:hypothetical protein
MRRLLLLLMLLLPLLLLLLLVLVLRGLCRSWAAAGQLPAQGSSTQRARLQQLGGSVDQPGQHVPQTHAATAAGKPDLQCAVVSLFFCFIFIFRLTMCLLLSLIMYTLDLVCTRPERLGYRQVPTLGSRWLNDWLKTMSLVCGCAIWVL